MLGADGRFVWSPVPGRLGGHRRGRIYGRLDCRAALKAIARGSYGKNRVFFADEVTAIAAGYRPCAVCMPEEYALWKEGLLWDDKAKGMSKHRIYSTSFASVYPLYVAKVEKKGRTEAEVQEVVRWLTGYSQAELDGQIEKKVDFETFFGEAPCLNPARAQISGVICGVRIEQIEEELMREIRYLDKLVDELAKGKAMARILRQSA